MDSTDVRTNLSGYFIDENLLKSNRHQKNVFLNGPFITIFRIYVNNLTLCAR